MGTVNNGKSEYVNKLSSIVEIDKHVGLIETVLHKYACEEEPLQKLLQKTKEKQNDKLLNMSIIGEFSSGKSSFINALLRRELLLSCSLQGTTVANTIIEYAPGYRIELKDQSRKTIGYDFSGIEEMAKKIEGFTTDPDFARDIYSVNIFLPSTGIKDKIRIIDTPGTNATELWHEDVTKKAINGLSDASVILIDSTKPFPETICRFVLQNLKKFLPQCAFVLTKFDMIEPEEREMILKYSRLKVKEVFGLDNALILPYSSLAVLEGKKGDEFYEMSVKSEKALFDFLVNQRAVAQTKKSISYIELMYGVTSKHLKTVYDGYVKDLSLVKVPDKTKLNSFITYQKAIRVKEFEAETENLVKNAMDMIYRKNHDYCEKIKSVIASKNSFEELNYYLCNNLLSVCRISADDIISCAESNADSVAKSFAVRVDSFYQSFFKTFGGWEFLDSKRELAIRNVCSSRQLNVNYDSKIEEGKLLINRLLNSTDKRNFELYKKKVRMELAIYMKALLNRVCYDIKVQFENLSSNLSHNLVFEIGNCSFYIDKQVDKNKEKIKNQMNEVNRISRIIKEKKDMLLEIESQLDLMF